MLLLGVGVKPHQDAQMNRPLRREKMRINDDYFIVLPHYNRAVASGIRLNICQTVRAGLLCMKGVWMNGSNPKRFSATPELADKVVVSLAHEINNPLQSLLNFLYLMDAEGCLSDRGKEYLALAREEAQRIAEIAQVAMSRLNPRAGPEEANVPELLRSVI